MTLLLRWEHARPLQGDLICHHDLICYWAFPYVMKAIDDEQLDAMVYLPFARGDRIILPVLSARDVRAY